MLGSDVLDVAIGLTFLYFVASLILSAAREWIEGILQMRAVHLERGIREILKDSDGTGIAKLFYDHPQISALFRGEYKPATQLRHGLFDGQLREWLFRGHVPTMFLPKDRWKTLSFRSNLPSYIPARNFALALLDLSARGAVAAPAAHDGPLTVAAVRAGVADTIDNPYLQRLILNSLDTAQGDLERARINLEQTFDSAMDRVSGWYRKETQTILFVIGLLVAILGNIDTIQIASALYRNPAIREAIVAEAQSTLRRVENSDKSLTFAVVNCARAPKQGEATAARPTASVDCAQQRLERLGYPVGWEKIGLGWSTPLPLIGVSAPVYFVPRDGLPVTGTSIFGWLLTALALMLGAPFWFDVLNKLMVIRSTVKPHEKSPEESSEDRQASAPPPPPPPPTSPPDGAAAARPAAAGPAPAIAGDDPDFMPLKWNDAADPQEGDL